MAIALLTDFGTEDIYTGVMKGVIYTINPEVKLIDITHGIEPQNVRQAALALMNAFSYFPSGTIFLVVIDPGVGSTRQPIAVRAGEYRFVAPDNGVLSYTLSQFSDFEAVEIDVVGSANEQISNTFHGRDIFAPTAARLSTGVTLGSLGKPLDRVLTMPLPQLLVEPTRIIGEIVHIDHFGNLVTSIGYMRWLSDERLMLTPVFGDTSTTMPVSAVNSVVSIEGEKMTGIRRAYSEAPRGSLLALVDSNDYLEISVNQGSAAARLDVSIGDRVELSIGAIDAAVRD